MNYDYGMSIELLFKSVHIKILLYIFTDSKSILDTVTAFKHLQKMRLTDEMVNARRAYRTNEISNIAWICSSQNIADNFTRAQGKGICRNAMKTSQLRFVNKQWVYKLHHLK